MSSHRRPVYFNASARTWSAPSDSVESKKRANEFHRKLDGYCPTPLISLDQIAKEIGVGAVRVKAETNRFGLPAFKFLGASWGTFRALCQNLELPIDSDLRTLREHLSEKALCLYTATAGNHGRGVAHIGAMLSVPVEIHMPKGAHPKTVALLEEEGAKVIISKGDYDLAMLEALSAARRHENGLLIQDSVVEGNSNDVLEWITHGYSTMFTEIDEQLEGKRPDLVVCPVGVGSLAQAAVAHFKSPDRRAPTMMVEPDTAPTLWKSLRKGSPTQEPTTHTCMPGMECAMVSTLAWPLLKEGVDASVTISDYEAHCAVLDLEKLGIHAGPCGGASLAALRRLGAEDKAQLGLNEKSVVVLLCTEGKREYNVPRDVSIDDPVLLTQTLVQIDSSSSTLGDGVGETAVAQYISAWLQHREIEHHWFEGTPGRPSVVGIARGSGGGKSLMLNGHIDTVTLQGYEGDALSGEIKDGNMYGRGTADMKSGIASMLIALANAADMDLRGDVIFTGVADEEDKSLGTEEIVAAGYRADAAIVTEPTEHLIGNAHKGFVWFEVDINGLAAHGSRPDLGVDAISLAGYFLVELDHYAKALQLREAGDAGPPSVHASIIKGGEEASSYPATCTITLERRTIAGETIESAEAEIRHILERLAESNSSFKYDLRRTFNRPSFSINADHPLVQLVYRHATAVADSPATIKGFGAWCDAALLYKAGIPSVVWGPRGYGLHSKTEWVEIESIWQVTDALTAMAKEFCT